MPGLADYQVPPPANWEDFESLCADLWKRIWGDEHTQRNGRTGQPQHGVDIVGRKHNQWVGVQCKGKDGRLASFLTEDEIAAEVQKAKRFAPHLSEFIIAFTGPRDGALQRRAREITDAHRGAGLFSVHVWSWNDILESLAEFPDIATLHFPHFRAPALRLSAGTDLSPARPDRLEWKVGAPSQFHVWMEQDIKMSFRVTSAGTTETQLQTIRESRHYRATARPHRESGQFSLELEPLKLETKSIVDMAASESKAWRDVDGVHAEVTRTGVSGGPFLDDDAQRSLAINQLNARMYFDVTRNGRVPSSRTDGPQPYDPTNAAPIQDDFAAELLAALSWLSGSQDLSVWIASRLLPELPNNGTDQDWSVERAIEVMGLRIASVGHATLVGLIDSRDGPLARVQQRVSSSIDATALRARIAPLIDRIAQGNAIAWTLVAPPAIESSEFTFDVVRGVPRSLSLGRVELRASLRLGDGPDTMVMEIAAEVLPSQATWREEV